MKKVLPLIILLAVGLAVWFVIFRKKDKAPRPPKDQPLAVSKYSAAFGNSLRDARNSYYQLSEAFTIWDSASILKFSGELQNGLASIKFEEIQNDTLIYETAISYRQSLNSDLEGIVNSRDIMIQRQSFHSFSQNFYDLLRTIKYDGAPVYLQECPMAFNDTEPGIWLSPQSAIRNPYLGTKHPKYKAGMLECGETKDSLQFASDAK